MELRYVTEFWVGTPKRYTQEIFSTLKGVPITPTTWSKGVPPGCFPCNSTLRNWRKKDKNYIHSIIPAEWSAHSDQNCMVCTRFEETQKPGRPSKSKSNRGRPLKSKNSQDSQTSTSYAGINSNLAHPPPRAYPGHLTLTTSPTGRHLIAVKIKWCSRGGIFALL